MSIGYLNLGRYTLKKKIVFTIIKLYNGAYELSSISLLFLKMLRKTFRLYKIYLLELHPILFFPLDSPPTAF